MAAVSFKPSMAAIPGICKPSRRCTFLTWNSQIPCTAGPADTIPGSTEPRTAARPGDNRSARVRKRILHLWQPFPPAKPTFLPRTGFLNTALCPRSPAFAEQAAPIRCRNPKPTCFPSGPIPPRRPCWRNGNTTTGPPASNGCCTTRRASPFCAGRPRRRSRAPRARMAAISLWLKRGHSRGT